MRRGRPGSALVAAAFAAAVGAAEPEFPPVPNPVLDPAQRWAFDGFSILPPQESDWFSLTKTRSRAVLVKRRPTEDDGVFVTVVADRIAAPMPTPDAFLEQMRARRGRGIDKALVNGVQQEEALETREPPWCTRYRVRADEVVPWYAPARVTEVQGRACLHPQVSGLVVDVAYAVRSPLAGEGREAREAAARFLTGLVLLPPAAPDGDAAAAAAAARDGDAAAAYRLGAMYERGRGVDANAAEAERWYRVAARAGEADALYNLGALLERGIGRPRDPQGAVEWFRRASDQRDAQAQLNLGLLYYKGDGVERDLARARGFFELSARNGNTRAQELLDRLNFAE